MGKPYSLDLRKRVVAAIKGDVPQSGDQTVRSDDQHGNRLDAAC